ncbi:MAG: hypothetical protein Q8P27_02890, partial [Candidatus Peregrinibacteria bacterium]|nr:hypothetical protein [Candidatus Peregrinibacteria bacterium]
MEEEMDQGWERDFSLGEGTDSDGVDARDKSPERTLASILEAAQHHLPEMLGLRGKEVSPAIQRVEAV